MFFFFILGLSWGQVRQRGYGDYSKYYGNFAFHPIDRTPTFYDEMPKRFTKGLWSPRPRLFQGQIQIETLFRPDERHNFVEAGYNNVGEVIYIRKFLADTRKNEEYFVSYYSNHKLKSIATTAASPDLNGATVLLYRYDETGNILREINYQDGLGNSITTEYFFLYEDQTKVVDVDTASMSVTHIRIYRGKDPHTFEWKEKTYSPYQVDFLKESTRIIGTLYDNLNDYDLEERVDNFGNSRYYTVDRKRDDPKKIVSYYDNGFLIKEVSLYKDIKKKEERKDRQSNFMFDGEWVDYDMKDFYKGSSAIVITKKVVDGYVVSNTILYKDPSTNEEFHAKEEYQYYDGGFLYSRALFVGEKLVKRQNYNALENVEIE